MRCIWAAYFAIFVACCASPASERIPQLRRSEDQFLAARTYALAALDKPECQGYFRQLMDSPNLDVRQEFLHIEFHITDIPWYLAKPRPDGSINYLLGLHICGDGMDSIAALDPFWMNQSSPQTVAKIMIHEFSHIMACPLKINQEQSEVLASGAELACFGTGK